MLVSDQMLMTSNARFTFLQNSRSTTSTSYFRFVWADTFDGPASVDGTSAEGNASAVADAAESPAGCCSVYLVIINYP